MDQNRINVILWIFNLYPNLFTSHCFNIYYVVAFPICENLLLLPLRHHLTKRGFHLQLAIVAELVALKAGYNVSFLNIDDNMKTIYKKICNKTLTFLKAVQNLTSLFFCLIYHKVF